MDFIFLCYICRPKELKQDFISCVATVVKHIQLPASFGYVLYVLYS